MTKKTPYAVLRDEAMRIMKMPRDRICDQVAVIDAICFAAQDYAERTKK